MSIRSEKNLKGQWEKVVKKRLKGYHVHIYRQAHSGNDKADELAQALVSIIGLKDKAIFKVGAVGPHTRANVEVDIPPEKFGEAVRFLQLTNFGHSILIHPDTGNDPVDHITGSMWINQPVPFKPNFFSKKPFWNDKKR